MADKILKYNKKKHQFNLNISGRHYIYRDTREDEIKEIDDWLINKEPIENRAYITFEDFGHRLHKNIPIKVGAMLCWYLDKPKEHILYWEIPTKEGTLFIHPDGDIVTYGDKYKNSIQINPEKVVISYTQLK